MRIKYKDYYTGITADVHISELVELAIRADSSYGAVEALQEEFNNLMGITARLLEVLAGKDVILPQDITGILNSWRIEEITEFIKED